MDYGQTTYENSHDIRILFGPMFGTDILVVEEEIAFCIGADEMFYGDDVGDRPHIFGQAANTFYIPWIGDAPNVRFRFGSTQLRSLAERSESDELPADFTVEYLSESSTERRSGRYNVVCHSGAIAFAVKRRRDDWSDEVICYTREPATSAGDSILALSEQSTPIDEPVDPSWRQRLTSIQAIWLLPLLGIAVTALTWWSLAKDARDERVEALEMLLSPAPTPNFIVPQADSIRVFNATQDGAQWDKQVLLKAPPDYSVSVASIAEERRRLEALLDAQGVPFVTVRMDDPAHPTLVMFDSATDEQKQRAVRTVTKAMPYASTIASTDVALGALDEDAQALLSKAGCPFRRNARKDGATYLISGSLSDESLASLRQLVYQFSQKWGTRSVDFRIQLRTDWLKGKTYRDSDDGYVLLDPTSWYFPQLF
ncbi:PrgH/EprH family type III secretion apparatus protein [Burkholderia ubonensis]|uniref:PrgH/EprH family type III secretion apparatus protein n=1 Tax=Burkholderia ubonensis TaxID=101571 RepID=UPI0012FCC651|nr:PrgH/EprH family type III secretion apparatus protein [Burkholderia ubonensis]